MKNSKISKIILLTTVLMISGICSAKDIDKDVIRTQCKRIHQELKKLYDSNPSAPCADSVLYSNYVMRGAEALVKSERYSASIKNLRTAYGNLNDTYLLSGRCEYFAPRVKAPLDDIALLINELEKATENNVF